MNMILLFLTLAVTVEAIVEYGKTILSACYAGDFKTAVLQLSAVATAILLCVLTGADLYAALGIPFAYPVAGCILTGIFASRGANYASDILGKLQKAGGTTPSSLS